MALELPTGSGKTIVGLVLAEWRRRARNERVVYVCPTVQLAEQVLQVAHSQGIEAFDFTGTSREWDKRDLADYTARDGIAVATYSALFNTNSRLSDAECLVFDDAHAAEGYVAGAWAVEVSRSADAYDGLFEAFEPVLDKHLIRRFVNDDGDSLSRAEVRLLPPNAIREVESAVDRVLANQLKGDASFRYSMIRSRINACLFYVSRASWYIRPMIPPTFTHLPFTGPQQRIYLSATLGEGGELERAFGRAPIERIPVPNAWARTGSGRRFFVFPDLARFDDEDDDYLIPEPADNEDSEETEAKRVELLPLLSELVEKHLILTQDSTSAEKVAKEMKIPKKYWIEARSESAMDDFKEADRAALLAPSRYDGMDLADEICRFEVFSGLPSASHAQDRFFSSKLRAGETLAERLKSRVIQGFGRCTRGPSDWSVVVVKGEDILRYLSDRTRTASMPLELQAEIKYGLAASRGSYSNNIALTASALEQDEAWTSNAEPTLANYRDGLTVAPSPSSEALSASVDNEVAAWRLVWLERWSDAGSTAVQVAERLTSSELRPYRGFWLYLASAWFKRAAEANPEFEERSSGLLKQAEAASAGVWLRESESAMVSSEKLSELDAGAAEKLVEYLGTRYRSRGRIEGRVGAMLSGLAGTEAPAYEQGLVELGFMLGASESYKSAIKARPDAVWIWPKLWATLEAKSEQTSDEISFDYVRKANHHLGSTATDRSVEAPDAAYSVMVVKTPVFHSDGVSEAADHLHAAKTDVVLRLAERASQFIDDIRPQVQGLVGEAAIRLVARAMWERQLLPSQVRHLLTQTPVRGAPTSSTD